MKQKWIPEDMAVPKKEGDYLVQTNAGSVTTLHFWNGYWNVYEGTDLSNAIDVDAWMPLPKKYKKGGKK